MPRKATKVAFTEDGYVYSPVVTIKDVFDAVQSGAADLGVVPFENSTHGVVTFTLDNLADRQGVYADLAVCGEVYLDVHHFLLGYSEPPAPSSPEPLRPSATFGLSDVSDSTTITTTTAATHSAPPEVSHVRRVLSHPQAFGQTHAFFSRHLKGVECVDVSSTSKAAELASADKSGATAAVAGEMAAEMFGLDVLARCIEDRDDNTTRFFILRRRKEGAGDSLGQGAGLGKGHKSLVSFTVPHRSPGALARVLDVFRTCGLNLTSINSLPSLISPFQYLFFVEFEGSWLQDPDGRVEGALDEIEKVAESWRWLGSWERAR